MIDRRPARDRLSRPATPRGKATVLIVEDELAIREMLGQVLADEGYRLLTAADGDAALDVLRRERVDVVLLDLMLPGLDGYGVLDALAKSTSLGATPIVVLTAGEVRRERLRGTPVARVLKKPVALEALLQVIEGLLAKG